MHKYSTNYRLGETVQLGKFDSTSQGVITGILIRGRGRHVQYEVECMDDLVCRTQWISEDLLDRIMFPMSDDSDTSSDAHREAQADE